jgi:hypothetical protein
MKNNKLIGDFMDIRSTGLSIYKESAYHYHDSWDWLMPVIEKIECMHDEKGNCFNVMMEAFECNISGAGLTLCLSGHTKIDATYKSVVEFIKEYNNG